MTEVWFTSDLHLMHKRIRDYCPNRPDGNPAEAAQKIIDNYNSCVGDNDTVYILGDLFFGPRVMGTPLLGQLKGKIHLILGNHDHKPEKFRHYESMQERRNVTIDGQRLVLDHYPLLTWEQAHRGAWMLHGHSHGGLDEANELTTRLDVGVDARYSSYMPLNFEQIRSIMRDRKYAPVDHHGGGL